MDRPGASFFFGRARAPGCDAEPPFKRSRLLDGRGGDCWYRNVPTSLTPVCERAGQYSEHLDGISFDKFRRETRFNIHHRTGVAIECDARARLAALLANFKDSTAKAPWLRLVLVGVFLQLGEGDVA